MRVVSTVSWVGCRRNYAAEVFTRRRRHFDHHAVAFDLAVAKDDRPSHPTGQRSVIHATPR